MPIVIIQIGNPGGKPSLAARGADEEHWARAVSPWQGHQHVVDFEVAVGREENTGRVVLCSVKGVVSQNSVANTLCPVALPELLPPANISPSLRP